MLDDQTHRVPSPVDGCLQTCIRCREIVERVRAHTPERRTGAYRSVGPHLRHCLEHFQSFVRGLETGTVDYDARPRDERIEREPEKFLEELQRIEERLRGLTEVDMDAPISVRSIGADGADPTVVSSSVQRELLFLSSHTIHHLAVIDLTAQQQGLELPRSLALAFSTAAHLRAGRLKETGR